MFLFLIMKYSDIKNELLNLYKDYNSSDKTSEIDYVLSEIKKVDLLKVKFEDFSLKEYKKAKNIIIKHLKLDMPIQKIFKKAYFYGLEFYVNNNVLTPRQDSEILIENALKENFNSCLDLCCGSGALGLAIKKNRPQTNLTLVDISPKALKVSKINVKKLNENAKIIKSNMFDKIKDKFDLIVCNPPYIETKTIENLDNNVKKFDPKISLDGGVDGLKFYKIIYENLDNYLNSGGVCFLEIGYNQGSLVDLFKQRFKNVSLIKDYNNLDRVIKIVKE